MKFRSQFVKSSASSVTAIMRTLWLVSGSLILGLVVGVHFAYHIKNVEKEAAVSVVHNVDYFISDESFSEVHNAKAALAGLSRRFLTELRSRAWIETQNNPTNSGNLVANVSSAAGLIPALEHGIEEFRGTEPELLLIPDLLRALKAERLYERWLEIYLTALYSHPTDELVFTFAREAMQMGRHTGRQDDVVNALNHVCSIPIDFPSKTDLQATLLQLRPRPTAADQENSDNQLIAAKPENLSTVQ